MTAADATVVVRSPAHRLEFGEITDFGRRAPRILDAELTWLGAGVVHGFWVWRGARSEPLSVARALVTAALAGAAIGSRACLAARRALTRLRAAFRPGQLGPVKAKFLADAACNASVKNLARPA